MKLTFKDLKQQKFQLDAEPTDTIADIKKKIFETKEQAKEWDPSLQKLIYSGKILADDKTVEFYKVEEKGFIVCMLSQPKPAKPAAPPKAAPSTPAKPTAPATPAAPAPAPAAAAASSAAATPAAPATPTPAGASAPAAAPAFNDPSALMMGTQRAAAIDNMVEMGFPRDQVEAAMRAAFYNPDRAVEYLMTGIPQHLQAESRPRQAQPAAPAAGQTQQQGQQTQQAAPAQPAEGESVNLFEAAAAAAAARGSQGGGAGGAGIQGLEFLRNNPQFQQLRTLVQEAPHMLEPILQQVGQGNPQLAAMISQNPDAFLQLLSEGVEGGDDDGEGMPGVQTISVTPEEHDAIDRLCQLGFNRDLVIQAYIACDRNEELTANYLFDNPDGDDDMN